MYSNVENSIYVETLTVIQLRNEDIVKRWIVEKHAWRTRTKNNRRQMDYYRCTTFDQSICDWLPN